MKRVNALSCTRARERSAASLSDQLRKGGGLEMSDERFDMLGGGEQQGEQLMAGGEQIGSDALADGEQKRANLLAGGERRGADTLAGGEQRAADMLMTGKRQRTELLIHDHRTGDEHSEGSDEDLPELGSAA
jgi:hypothetical protein